LVISGCPGSWLLPGYWLPAGSRLYRQNHTDYFREKLWAPLQAGTVRRSPQGPEPAAPFGSGSGLKGKRRIQIFPGIKNG
jgi:hypothetical protein